MNYFILSLIMLVIGVGGIIGFMVLARSLEYTNIKSKGDCDKEGVSPKKVGDKCGAWVTSGKTSGTCWKGKIINKSGVGLGCEKHSQPGALVLAIVSAICILLSIIFLIMGFVHHHKEKNNSSSSLSSSSPIMNF
jgi:hypothetical protein